MADNVIDELSLQIEANASSAIQNLSKMQTQLRHLAKDIGSVSSAGRSLSGLSNTFAKIGNINTNNLGKAIDQLERLNKINLKNLDGKTIDLDIKISGADRAERKIYAMQDAVKHIDVTPLAKKFSDLFGLKGVDAKRIKEVYRQAIQDMASGGMPNSAFTDWLGQIETKGLRISKESFSQDIAAMRNEYVEFLKYLENNKIGLTQAVDRKTFNESTNANERMTFFNQTGSALDGRWEELATLFPTIMAGIRNVVNEEEQVYAILEKIREARAALQAIDIREISGVDSDNAWSSLITAVGDAPKELQRIFDEQVQKAMKESANKIPLDIQVDPVRIEQQISNAIKQATAKPFPVNLSFDFTSLKGDVSRNVTSTFENLNVEKLGSLSMEMQSVARSMLDIAGANPKDSGLITFVNAMNRLAQVDTSKFDAGVFGQIVSGIAEVANVGEISSGINRLVASLARLASAGQNTEYSANALPRLGNALREVMTGITSAGAIPAEISAFATSLGTLANAGKRTAETASNLEGLGIAVKDFMTAMQSAPVVDEKITNMVSAIAQMASSGSRAGSAAQSINRAVSDAGSSKSHDKIQTLIKLMNELGSVFDKVAGRVKSGASRIISSLTSMRSAGNGLQSATASIKNMIAAMIGFHGITSLVNLSKQVIALGADITEIDHIVESVFGDMAETVDTWAKSAITSFGIAEHSAKRYAGVLSSMFQASGIGYKDAGRMGIALTELAGDISAFYNIDTETAFKKIQSGMAGMVRPLRDLGIDLTAATLQEYAQKIGIEKKYNAMTQAEKVMLRYRYLMENTSTQQGDFTRTNLSLANSLRTLKAYLAEVGTQIGAGLGSAIRHVVVWLNEMMKYLVKAANAFAVFMQTIFGKYKGGASGIAMDMSYMEDATSDVADSSSGIADGLDDADEAARQLKKDLSVLPFDELNQLNKDVKETSKNSGSGSGAGSGDPSDIVDGLLDWNDLMENSEAGKLPEWISEWAKRVKAAFFAHDWTRLGQELADGINKGIQKVYDILNFENFKKKVDPFINGFIRTFNTLIQRVDWNLLGRTIGEAVNDIVYAANRLLTGINWTNIGKSIASFANGLVDEIDFKEVGKLIGNKFMALWETLYGFATDFDWKKFGEKLADGISGINDAIDLPLVGRTLATFVNGIFDTIKEFTEKAPWDEVVDNIVSGINTFIEETDWKKNAKILGEFISKLCDALIRILKETDWEGFGKGLAEVLQNIPWDKLLEVVARVIVNALGGLLKGLASTPAGMLVTAFIAALGVAKIGTLLAPFASIIISTFSSLLKVGVPKIASAVSMIGSALGALGPAGWITLAVVAGVTVATVAIVKNWDKVKAAAQKVKEAAGKAWEFISKKVTDEVNRIVTTAQNDWKIFSTIFSTGIKIMNETVKTGMESARKKVAESAQAIHDKVSYYFGLAKEKTSSAFDNIKTTASNAFSDAKRVVLTAASTIQTNVASRFSTLQTGVSQKVGLLKTNVESTWTSIKNKTDITFNSVYDKITRKIGDASRSFGTALDTMASKAKEKFDTITGKIGEVYSSLKETFGQKWKLAIDNITEKIKVPHFSTSGSFSLNPPRVPKITFNGWWKKGGLFKGGDGQIIGLAEGGRDEAVLPLEDRRAMSRIGDAISSSGGGSRLTKDDIIEAVVEGLMANPMSQEVIVNAVLKMENDEVLARHVERGRRKMDSRYNPVAAY